MAELNQSGKALVQAAREADRPSNADRARVLEALRGRLGGAAMLGVGLGHSAGAPRAARAPGAALAKWSIVAPVVLAAGALLLAPRVWHGKAKAAPVASSSAAALASAAPVLAMSASAMPEALPPVAVPSASATEVSSSALVE